MSRSQLFAAINPGGKTVLIIRLATPRLRSVHTMQGMYRMISLSSVLSDSMRTSPCFLTTYHRHESSDTESIPPTHRYHPLASMVPQITFSTDATSPHQQPKHRPHILPYPYLPPQNPQTSTRTRPTAHTNKPQPWRIRARTSTGNKDSVARTAVARA